MVCKNCKTTISDNSAFCPACGCKVEKEATKGATLIMSSAFCRAGDLNDTPAPKPAPAPNPAPRPVQPPRPTPAPAPRPMPTPVEPPKPASEPKVESAKKKVALIGICATVAAVALILLLIFGIGGPKSTAKKFAKALEDGDVATMGKLFHESVFDDVADKNDWQDDMLDKLYDGVSYQCKVTDMTKIGKAQLSMLQNEHSIPAKAGRIAYVQVTVTEDDDSSLEQLVLFLIKVDGKWYIWCDDPWEMFD